MSLTTPKDNRRILLTIKNDVRRIYGKPPGKQEYGFYPSNHYGSTYEGAVIFATARKALNAIHRMDTTGRANIAHASLSLEIRARRISLEDRAV